MIKKILLIIIIGALLMVSGCSSYLRPQSPKTGTNVKDAQGDNGAAKPSSPRPGSLGGICLGDSPEEVVKILGNDYKESLELDDSGYYGEDMNILDFEKGIVVRLGKESNKVISVVSNSSNFQTDLEIKVGNDANTALEKYKSKFKEAVSRHSGEALEGWFHINDEQIIIFDFDRNDHTRVNDNVEPKSPVQEIVLAYWEHFH